MERWRNVSIAKKLYFVVGIMAVLIVGELITLRFAMHTLSAARAFVGGEGLWSKAQKDAAISLQRYGRTRDEAEFTDFLHHLEVPHGDREARLELAKPSPDLDVVRRGFVRGRVHPDDIDPMIDLLRRFAWTSYLSRAITVWGKGDELLVQLEAAGHAYHAALLDGDEARAARALEDIKRINEDVTALEDEFSFVLGAGSRWLEQIVLTLLSIAVLLVESIGLSLAFVTSRSISRGLSALDEAAHAIGRGDFRAVAVSDSQDELGRVSRAVAQMGLMLRASYGELEARVAERTGELAHSRDQLRVILEGITDGITVIDGEGRFVYANDAGARLCGAPSVDAFLSTPQARFFEDLDIRDEGGAPFPMERLPSRLAFAGVENPPEVVIRFRRRSGGEERWSIVKSAPVFDESRKTKLVVTIFKDFTDHKRAEDAVKLLDEASQILASSMDYRETLRRVAELSVPRLADACAIDLVDADREPAPEPPAALGRDAAATSSRCWWSRCSCAGRPSARSPSSRRPRSAGTAPPTCGSRRSWRAAPGSRSRTPRSTTSRRRRSASATSSSPSRRTSSRRRSPR